MWHTVHSFAEVLWSKSTEISGVRVEYLFYRNCLAAVYSCLSVWFEKVKAFILLTFVHMAISTILYANKDINGAQ